MYFSFGGGEGFLTQREGGGRFGSRTILLLGGGTGWGLHEPFTLLTTHGFDGPGRGAIVVFRGLRGVVRTRHQVRHGVGADGEELAAAVARFTVAIVDIVFTMETELDGGVTVDRGAEGRGEEGGDGGDEELGEHGGWVGVGVGVGYGAIARTLYVDGVDDIVGRIHDAIWLEWVSPHSESNQGSLPY